MLTVIGAGPGNPKYLTGYAIERIKGADVVMAFGRVADSLRPIRGDIVRLRSVSSEEILKHCQGDAVLMASGDPTFYGIVGYLKKNGIVIDDVIPGISSMQYMFSKLGMEWQDAYLTSAHGRDLDVDELVEKKLSVVLLDKETTPNTLSGLLYEHGARGLIHAGSNLSYDDENIVSRRIGEEIKMETNLTMVVIENENAQGQ